MIKMTKKAATQFKADLGKRSLPENTLLRIDVESAPEKDELQLVLRLDNQEPQPSDEVATTEGARLAVDRELAQQLGNAQLDYHEDKGGFIFQRVEATQ